jgi:hypothetical protein
MGMRGEYDNDQGERKPMAYFERRCFAFTQGW